MTINKKTGEVRLNDLDIRVDNFNESALTERAKENYNSGKDIKPYYYPKDWPKGTWYDLYFDTLRNLLRWKKK